uniref:Uncharacterized protein n=1 Tax=mine drainage metagenome TaxID=410659 RepID=E6QU10_9ZZZZ
MTMAGRARRPGTSPVLKIYLKIDDAEIVWIFTLFRDMSGQDIELYTTSIIHTVC